MLEVRAMRFQIWRAAILALAVSVPLALPSVAQPSRSQVGKAVQEAMAYARTLPDASGGLWLTDEGAVFAFTHRATDEQTADVLSRIRPGIPVMTVRVDWSEAEIAATKDAIVDFVQTQGPPHVVVGVGTDTENNAVRVALLPEYFEVCQAGLTARFAPVRLLFESSGPDRGLPEPTPTPDATTSPTSSPAVSVPSVCLPPSSPEPSVVEPSAGPTSATMLVACGYHAYPGLGIDGPRVEPGADSRRARVLRDALRTYREEVTGADAVEWRLAGRDGTGFLLLGRDDRSSGSGWLSIEAERRDGRWSASMGGCDPRRVLAADIGVADWWLDPAFPTPGPGSTELQVLVLERACASGKAPDGRIAAAVALATTTVQKHLGRRRRPSPASRPRLDPESRAPARPPMAPRGTTIPATPARTPRVMGDGAGTVGHRHLY
jgi:hypothetical protein